SRAEGGATRGIRAGALSLRRGARRTSEPLPPPGERGGSGGAERDGARHGAGAADHPRAEDGRALVAGEYRGLQGRSPRGRRVAEVLPAPDDRRGDRAAGAGGGHGRRGGGAAGHRHGASPRGPGGGDRRPARGEGAGRVARCEIHRPAPGGERRRPGRLRPRALRRCARATAGDPERARCRGRRGDHHRHGPRKAGSAPAHRRDGGADAARLGGGGPRRRGGRELRAIASRRGGGGQWRADLRAHQPALAHAERREPALRPQRLRGGAAPRSRRKARARFLGRDRRGDALDARGKGPGGTGPGGPRSDRMMGMLLVGIYVFVLAIFVGFEVINKVPSTLHTPLMSGANAISGITIVGALQAATTADVTVSNVLGALAIALATINVVGGYLVSDRMLRMFGEKR